MNQEDMRNNSAQFDADAYNGECHRTSIHTRRYSQSLNPRRIAAVSQICINIVVIVSIMKNTLIHPMTLSFDFSRISQGDRSFPIGYQL